MSLDTTHLSRILLRTILRFSNLASVLLAVAAGLLFPRLGMQLNSLISPVVAVLIYLSLTNVTLNSGVVRSKAGPVCLALLVSLCCLPLVAKTLVSLVTDAELGTGLFLMSVAPTTAGSAIVWTQLADGDVQLTTIVSVTSMLFAPVTMPVLLLAFMGRDLQIEAIPLFANLAAVLGAALVLRYFFPSTPLDRQQEEYATQFGIVALIYISLSSSSVLQYSVTAIAFAVFVSMAILLVGYLLAMVFEIYGVVREGSKNALFFSSSLKNLGVALLGATAFASGGVISGVIVYYVVQQVLSSIVVDS